MSTHKAHSNVLRWGLVGGLLVAVALADWNADGVVPHLVLGSATLNLTSAPDGAKVLLDGDAVGHTPLRTQRVLPGSIVVRMEHRFHDALARRIEAGRGTAVDIHMEFPPSKGSLEIVTNPRGANIAVDGRNLDQVTPMLLAPHPTGSFEVTTWIHGRERKTETVDVLPRQNTEVSFELERVPMGEVHVSRFPRDLELTIDGNPYEPGMTLPIGTYRLHARRSGYVPLDRTVELKRGRNDHSINLKRLTGSLVLAVKPEHATIEVDYPDADGWRTKPYDAGIAIPTGPVVVRAVARGFRPYEARLRMGPSTLEHAIRLEKYDVEPGRRFRDKLASGGEGPLVVVVGTGSFRMGSESGSADERPVRTVRIDTPFAIGVFETTRDDYERYRKVRGVPVAVSTALRPEDTASPEPLGRLPMSRLGWEGAVAYADWLSSETGHRYRLPSEAEWEYVARAGSAGRHYFGTDAGVVCAHANVADATYAERYRKPGVAECSDGAERWAPVGSYSANAFGVHDILGNVEEWVADCWHDNYTGAPADQRARSGRCTARVLRGGAWDSTPDEATASYRTFSNRGSGTRGVRVVRDL